MGGGQVQQGNAAAAAAALFDHHPGGDASDAVMARWLQSAGLQHLASPVATADQRLLPNLLMQGYGPQTAEEKQRLYKILKNLNFGGESGSEPYSPTGAHGFSTAASTDGLYSPELRGEFGAGLLDLHSMDDTELLSEHIISEELFEASPFIPVHAFDNNADAITGKQQRPTDGFSKASSSDKESSARESNVAKIKVVVRKDLLTRRRFLRKKKTL
ncbi:hypothetical protein HPP92_010676 [Vanilla planifolia]|uniref:Uncharacterized protein n=1 Tax=Vanilla planifolia TaxID=51239 RepID=A0A835QXL9_VANPL|nr:hypothetical protein HPP92_010676 [Vanilla planifolia]